MSQENVEIVRRWVLDPDPANMSDVDPDIVWNPVDEAESQGHDAVRASLARWKGEWDEYDQTAEEFVDICDRVVATMHFHGRGRGSGVETDARFYGVYTVRDGKIVRMDEFTERSEALEAAGLRE